MGIITLISNTTSGIVTWGNQQLTNFVIGQAESQITTALSSKATGLALIIAGLVVLILLRRVANAFVIVVGIALVAVGVLSLIG
jgi:uncharacterized protein YybS (DUF2232 family)